MKRIFLTALAIFSIQVARSQDSTVTVHEWGTFTTLAGSDGKQLQGLYLDEEKLPGFVYDLDMKAVTDTNTKGIVTKHCKPLNVLVKMETPVLYFYADKETNFKLRVDFTGGLISQWYPRRSAGTQHITNCLDGLDFLNNEYRNGFVEWEGKILAPNSPAKLTENAVGEPVWLAPRQTQSNLVKMKDSAWETEKYLFYRGIGNFNVPLRVSFDNYGLLEVSNNSEQNITYAMVYHKPIEGEGEIWWAGGIAKGALVKMYPQAIVGIPKTKFTGNFKSAMISAGLYKDEAEAMLKTWEKSYFETPGVKVFWLVPRYITDTVLPLKMTPLPKKLERVMVGRSEVLTPVFEELIYQMYKHGSADAFYGDRYAVAYNERYNQMAQTGRIEDTASEKYYIHYNTYNHILYIVAKTKAKENQKLTVDVVDAGGVPVHTGEVAANDKGYIYYTVDFSDNKGGIHFLNIISGNKTHTEKINIINTK